jgi:hypothetical protein
MLNAPHAAHVLQLHTFGRGHAGDCRHLVEHQVLGSLRRQMQLAASEADEIRSPDGTTATPCCFARRIVSRSTVGSPA